MFGFLKEKLKAAAQKFSSQIKEAIMPAEAVEEEKPKPEIKPEAKKEAKPERAAAEKKPEVKKEKQLVKEEPKPEIKVEEKKVEEKKGFFQAIKQKFAKEEKKEPEIKPRIAEEKRPEFKEEKQPAKEEPKPEIKAEEKKGFFAKLGEKIAKTTLSEEKFNDLFWDLEVALLENNVAVEVIEKIKEDLKKSIVNVPISRKGIDEMIAGSLKRSIEQLFVTEDIDIIEQARKKQPYVIAVFGVNGAGKTTSIAKLVRLFEKNGISTVLAAADTFRTAAIEQLEEHANKLGVKVVKHEYGSDSAAVAFDAIKHAQSKGRNVVIIDTAGRTHVNQNLMDELKKLVRVAKPDLKLFVGDALTGNDAVEQARAFNDAVGIDGIILTKVDVDEKGGSSVSISYVTKKPILYIGTGQGYDDLQKFSPSIILQNLQLEGAEA
jgi:fused signal recognition particle receptor